MLIVPRPRQTEEMDVEKRRIADAAIVRGAIVEDLDELVQQIWDVATEARWIGTQVPFDRHDRRFRLDALLTGASSTLLVVDTSTSSGPGVVGHISVAIAPYGVADIGMLIVAGWRGLGLGRRLLDAAVEWSTLAGAHKITLEVWPHNSSALELYRRAGFVEEGRKRRHYRRHNGEIWDAVLMGRSLS
jgi:RimJ/RimL family protein N-acetyltransferase